MPASWVKSLVEDVMGPSSMVIGKVIEHPDGYKVKVISGQYWGSHGLSNFWRWRRVSRKTNKPYGKIISGYGW